MRRDRNAPGPGVALLAAVLLAGCAGPVGPVVGDWRNNRSGIYGDRIVELVLDGTQDATSGRYHWAETVQNTENGAGSGETRWDGNWSREPGQDGRPIYRLLNDLPGRITRWELTQDGALRPATPDGRLDPSPQAPRYALFPVPRGLGYGRV